ncbi:tetratricopeptide repeat protein [Microseira wollei]|nr:tetratricopeptide repeat protein [Microseira wollei]
MILAKKTGVIWQDEQYENLLLKPMGKKTCLWINILAVAVSSLSLTTSPQALALPSLENIQKNQAPVPSNGSRPENRQQALGYYRQGVTFQQQGQLEAAIAQYQEAIRLNPNMAEAYLNMGAALAAIGKQPEAIAAYREAIRANPNLAEAHHNLGNAFAQQGKLTEATQEYTQAIRINPNYAKAHYNLGNVLARLGERQQAMAQWREAIRVNPEFAEAYANLGVTLTRQGQRREAVEILKKARDLFKAQGKSDQAEQIDRILQRLERGTTVIT